MSVLRWVIIILLFYLIVRVLKSLMAPSGPKEDRDAAPPRGAGNGGPEDLVRDPQCGVYFPRKEGVASLVRGKVLYFHDAECRDRYLAGQSGADKGGTA